MLTVKDICEKIWKFEREENILEFSIDGIYIWELIRMEIYYEITMKTGVFGIAHGKPKSTVEKIKTLLVMLKSISNTPLYVNQKYKKIIYDHSRKVKYQNEYCDIYTKFFIKETKEDILVIEEDIDGRHLSEKSRDRRNIDLIKILSRTLKTFVNIKEKNKIEIFINKLNKLNILLGIELNFEKKVKKRLKIHKLEYKMYTKIMKKLKIEEVYVVVAYGKGSFIAAAKKLGIKVNEFQHGTISKYHLGYSYPHENLKLNYFPDKIYSFGEYWNQFLPKINLEIENYGFRYLRENKLNKVPKIKGQILFISQGVIGKELSELAIKIAKSKPKFKVIYKLHPSEYNRWNDYEELFKNRKLKNIEIIDNNNKSLYEYMNESEYQVGVFSTAIFEGLMYECKTLLYELPGIEYMKELIENKYCKKIKTLEEFEIKSKEKFKVLEKNQDFF